ncbi:proline iminopeptidase [Chitinophaga sp. YR627]|nr:proline iminopeptidase [Chitinophaga sp. YR627]
MCIDFTTSNFRVRHSRPFLFIHPTNQLMMNISKIATLLLFLLLTAGQVFSQLRTKPDTTIVTSDGVRLFLKVSGHGKPCIFVHGGPGAWSKSFEALGGNVLEENLTMYYYDQRGSGRSTSPANKDYSLSRMVEDIEDVRRITGADKVYLLAHSFGGIPAYHYALKYPTHVAGLIMLNATLSINHSLLSQIGYINKILDTSFTTADTSAIVSTYVAAITALREKGKGFQMLSDNSRNVALLDSIDRSAPRNYDFGRVALLMPEYFADFRLSTADLNIPVLVISGAADHNIGPDHYRYFRFPNQRLNVIQGGHLLYYEKNTDFKRAVTRFLR